MFTYTRISFFAIFKSWVIDLFWLFCGEQALFTRGWSGSTGSIPLPMPRRYVNLSYILLSRIQQFLQSDFAVCKEYILPNKNFTVPHRLG